MFSWDLLVFSWDFLVLSCCFLCFLFSVFFCVFTLSAAVSSCFGKVSGVLER